MRKSYQGGQSLEVNSKNNYNIKGFHFISSLTNYYIFKGNQSRKFLKSAHKLEDELVSAGGDVLTKGHPYIKAVKLFDDVVSACFGRNLNPQYEELIKRFEGAYRDLGLDPTQRVF